MILGIVSLACQDLKFKIVENFQSFKMMFFIGLVSAIPINRSNPLQSTISGLGDGTTGLVKSVTGLVAHPVDTIYNLTKAVTHPVQTGDNIINNFKHAYAEDPYHAVG
jgi:hypothetical protein